MQKLPGSLAVESNANELDLWTKLLSLLKSEEGILGYKLPSLGVAKKDDIPSFIIRSEKFGLILLDVVTSKVIEISEDREFWKFLNGEEIYSRDIIVSQFYVQMINKLSKNKTLYNFKSKKLTFADIRSYIIFPQNTRTEINSIWGINLEEETNNSFICKDDIDNKFNQEVFIDKEVFHIEKNTLDIVDSLFENTDRGNQKIKPISQPITLNDFIQKSQEYTFKLDEIQRRIAMQIPPGPQRIRGLAGTGKTIILSMKAALIHKDFPQFKVLFVFNTQSMYNQIQKFISDYYIKEKQENPNWTNLEILHGWGGQSKIGFYFKIASQYGVRPKTFFEVKSFDDPFEKVCTDLLIEVKHKLEPIYDVVLIDEAQDFPPAFFEIIYYLTKEPKRIIWAYDEFQSLRELKIKESDEMFGKKKLGYPNIPESALEGEYEGGIDKDFVLPNSYRNPRINLMLAHGIGMGLYNQDEIIPIEDRISWEARGYRIIEPIDKTKFEYQDNIVIERPIENSKNILENLLRDNNKTEKDLVYFNKCNNIEDELNRVIEKIDNLINSQLVAPEEIVVINLDGRKAKTEFQYLRQELDKKEIKAITPGFIEGADQFKEIGFITLTTPFRAKGNEANIIIIFNSQNVVNNFTYRIRNAFFVAVTRSRGWCYIYGHGEEANILQQEIFKIVNDYPYFRFTFPKSEDIRRRLRLLTANKDKELEKVEGSITAILNDEIYTDILMKRLKRDDNLSKKFKQLLENDED
jgi:superfamily I DNA and RNA helicase